MLVGAAISLIAFDNTTGLFVLVDMDGTSGMIGAVQEVAEAGLSEASGSAELHRSGALQERSFLKRIRRLTFEGRRAGEGYFSPDGTKLVFQSERELDNPFFQIYEIDLTSGESRRISPGHGKTTCAFYQPGSEAILFASTHHDPRSAEHQATALRQRVAGSESRYDWDYDPQMEIYLTDARGRSPRRLTTALGYDAEASFSPDGRWIVFTSTRDAYGVELSPTQRERLELEPAYFGEIYVMRADGTQQRRLTEVPGYDGGPFFLPDGSGIVWRRFDESGLIADVWTMAADGSDQRQVTRFGSMSWAPYPHPSGEYVFFASNKHGFENFELFIVDLQGLKEPVRVTFTDGFDGLPVPAPDGGQLAWTSTRYRPTDRLGQIYLADWDHEAALTAIREAPAAVAEEDQTSRDQARSHSWRGSWRPRTDPVDEPVRSRRRISAC